MMAPVAEMCRIYMRYYRTKKLRIQFIKPTLYAMKCEHNRYTVSYMFRHFFSAIMHGTYNIKKKVEVDGCIPS
jgi:hypothetical protein